MQTTAVLLFCLTFFFLKCFIVDVVDVVGATCKTHHHSTPNITYRKRNHRASKNRGIDAERFQELKIPVLYKNEKPLMKQFFPHQKLLDQGYYITLYDTNLKLPVYSAYTLDVRIRDKSTRINGWIINPLINKTEQPTVDDYRGVKTEELHGGHLFPQFYNNRENEKELTNLITNIALQYASFNINAWNRLENSVKYAAEWYCNFEKANRYFVTGVIPSIPSNQFKEINIPDFFWTAVCCDSSVATDENERSSGWSFAYKVRNENTKVSQIDMYLIEDFLNVPGINTQFIQIFANHDTVKHCLFNTEKTVRVVERIKRDWDVKDRFTMNAKLQEIFVGSPPAEKRLRPE